MKIQEVILRAMAKKATWWQAAEIIGISDRQMQPTMSCSASACDMPTFRAKTIPFTREMSTSDRDPRDHLRRIAVGLVMRWPDVNRYVLMRRYCGL